MKKFLKFVGIISFILVIGFIVLIFIPDEEDSALDSRYDDTYYDNNSHSSNNANAAYTISEEFLKSKREMINQGLVREPQVKLKGNGEDTVTIFVYMNGSDLESDYSEATTDLTEMVKAGSSDKVNIVLQTMGTKKWDSKYGISAKRTQRFLVNGKGLTLVDDSLGQLDCTRSDTLTNFIKWGASNYPADRYMLIFWDHGGGPVYGFGYDQWNKDEYASLSSDEIKEGLKRAGVYFDFIGMDCCIMSCLETGCALYDYADYFITSEDFESGLGWSYTNWLKALYNNTSISTIELGKLICDSMVSANEKDTSNGDDSIMAVIDLSMMKVLYASWIDFAYANKDTLLGTNYSERVLPKKGGRVMPRIGNFLGSFWNEDSDDPRMADYYVTDIMAVAQNIDSEESKALSSAVNKTLVYVRASSGDAALTGISVTLPYGDSEFYDSMKTVFTNIGLDKEYIDWLGNFTSVSSSSTYDYDDWYDSWGGWDDYEDDYDWEDWNYYDDDSYDDGYLWDDFDFGHSFNFWYDLLTGFFGDDNYDDDYDYDDYWNNYWDDDYWDDDYWDDDYWEDDDWEDDEGFLSDIFNFFGW